ncbi:hypothetical protein XELAEV_18014254mg [Xenopus laevis]|uniref:Uncharacterized protein n=1 Tax=Xenopus laevis TaxID=8355 RepID=A0A974DIK6_XENLA|nr:hypothetical protein XELAEV_18014254mg [Xenopus laevis]
MTMTSMPESLSSPVSGKAVFMEFGPLNQQMPPSPMSHGHYSMHGLHSHHDTSHSGASSFSKALGYSYVNSVSSHSSSPYISNVQSYPNSSSLSQTNARTSGLGLLWALRSQNWLLLLPDEQGRGQAEMDSLEVLY